MGSEGRPKVTDTTVFLDRDGTINEDRGYIKAPGEVKLLPGASEALRKLRALGVRIVIITNQSGIGRGYYTEEDLFAVNKRVEELLSEGSASYDAIYYCPHSPEECCGCRKPEPGMVERAASELGIDTTRSYVVGDKVADMGLARNVGAKGVMVLTGHGPEERERLTSDPDFLAAGILEAVEWIERDIKEEGT